LVYNLCMPEAIKYRIKEGPQELNLGKQGDTRVRVEAGEEIEMGGERLRGNPKRFVEASVGERKAGSFVAKEFATQEEALEEIEKVETLRHNGVPVPSTVRYYTEGNKHCVLYTDLTEGGKYQVWSTSSPPDELKAWKLTKEQINTIEQDASKIGEVAAAIPGLGMFVGEDAYFLIRDPKTNQVKVILGDFGVRVSRKTHQYYREEVEWGNAYFAETFTKRVSDNSRQGHA